MSLLSTIIAVGVLVICAFPLMKLREGSFLHAVLSPLHGVFDRNFNVFASQGLRPFGLIPLAALCVLNMVLSFMGSGLLQFIFRCTAFYSLYLIGTFLQGRNPIFSVVSKLPGAYPLIALGGLLVSVLMLLLIQRIKNGPRQKRERKERQPKRQKASEAVEDDGRVEKPEQVEDLGIPAIVRIEESPEDPVKVHDHDPAKSKIALSSLTDVQIPTFESFPNYLSTASVSSVDREVYNVAEREAQIRREEQAKREAEQARLKRIAEEEERARLEAEENRKRLQNMFKPRNLMRRLHEDAQAEKVFPTYGSKLPDVDFGISENKPDQPVQTQIQQQEQPVQQPVQFQSPYEAPKPRIVPGNDIPVAQMQNPFASRGGAAVFSAPQQNVPETAEPEPVVQSQSVFKEAAAQAEIDEQLVMRRRQAEFERKHLEEMQELERQRREAEEAARKAEEELAAAKAEMLRQQEAAKTEAARLEAARFEAERQAAMKAEEKVEEPVEDAVEEDEGISDEDMAENEARGRKGPDIDMVSGVAGLKSAAGGNSYLLDKQKFVYEFPPESILKHYPVSATVYEDPENDPNGQIIVETLAQFKIGTSLIGVQHGPTFTLYELSLAPGIKVTAVLNLAENLAMQLSVEDVRILAPIPGKVAIGVEVPNKKRDVIGFDVMMPALKGKYYKIPMVLGKTITGESIVIDLAKTPHLLVAGTTGSGKSVCINGLICSVLYTKTPKEVRMILVDPKMVELSPYNGIPHLLTPVITDAKKAIKAMNFVVEEMERRMALFSSVGAKKIEEYNEKITTKGLLRVKLPYIMVIIDEFADLMLAVGK
ncbi:MAG: DNA translocase FtsK, partial [Spirochaetales bacterium]|nr:DNA translocase FtsK [Spirochaetales bacterium]